MIVLIHDAPTIFPMKPFPDTAALATDCVVLEPDGRVLLVRRKQEPFAGFYALSGGFVGIGETIEAACCREVGEEAGVVISEAQLQLIGVYSDPARDPRGHSVSIVYGTTLERLVDPQPASDAEGAEWIMDWKKVRLAFNHAEILMLCGWKQVGSTGRGQSFLPCGLVRMKHFGVVSNRNFVGPESPRSLA
jgi:8-oxo-dGTP diphosphatase